MKSPLQIIVIALEEWVKSSKKWGNAPGRRSSKAIDRRYSALHSAALRSEFAGSYRDGTLILQVAPNSTLTIVAMGGSGWSDKLTKRFSLS